MARLLLLLLAVTCGACAARGTGTAGPVPRPFPGARVPPGGADAPADAGRAEAPIPVAATPLIATAMSLRGVPYRNGGADPAAGFDCSGFVQYVFASHGASLPREVRDQFHIGEEIDRDEVRAGDLIFFETVSKGASHVGLAIGDGQFIHAPSSTGVVRVERFSSSYWASRFVGARRVTASSVTTSSAARRIDPANPSRH